MSLREWTVAGALVETPQGVLLVRNVRHGGFEDWSTPGGVIARYRTVVNWEKLKTSEKRERLSLLDGVPAGLTVREEDLARDLTRRQGGHGRGGRQLIEHDAAHIVAGVRGGLTLGSPITLEES